MADKIRLLPEVVANQIAAGEVVNRPSSVVKEMMENAIDAGAASVKVNFRDGGRELIQIVDDGCGMSPIDARMAFDRHATSKIRDVEDIYALHTFGFRGEALASIAAVAQVKRDYVDCFAEVLTAEQIRQLYNAEGQIGTSIKRAAGERRTEMPRVLSGSGRRVSQDWGAAGDYTAIETGAFFHVTVSPTARTITVTADDNVIDYLKLDRTGGRLAFSLLPRSGRTRRIENLSISVVVPVSASLREISVGSYAGFESATPLRVKNLSVSVSSYGSVKADIVDSGDSRLQVSSYGRFTGKVESAGAQLTVASYGTFEGPLSCVGIAAVSVGSYGSFNGDIRAAQADLSVSSGGKFSGALRADAASVGVSSYARFSGPIDVSELKASVSSSGVLQSAFAGRRCEASVASYGKLVFTGSADVEAVSVQLSPQSSFSAPDLRVKRYDIRTSSYSKADVWCSESLRVDAAATSQVTYDGPCRLEAQTSTVRRR